MNFVLSKHFYISFHILININLLCIQAWNKERPVGGHNWRARQHPPRRHLPMPRSEMPNETDTTDPASFEIDSDEDYFTPSGGDGCERLQIVFLFDQTTSFQRYFESLKESIKELVERVNKILPNSEFGLSIFGSWNVPTGESCYKSLIDLTNNTSEFIDELQRNNLPGLEDDTSGLSALGFAAADNRGLGWDTDSFTGDGQAIHKFLVFMTDSENRWTLNDDSGRRPWAGDGRDSCTRSHMPRYNDLHRILQETRTNIIGIYGSSDIEEEYSQHFMSLGFPYCYQDYRELYLGFKESLVSAVVKCILRVLNEIDEYYNY